MSGTPGTSEGFVEEITRRLQAAEGFWLGVVYAAEASLAPELEALAMEAAPRVGSEFEVLRAEDVDGLVRTARDLLSPATEKCLTWVDWAEFGATINLGQADQGSEDSLETIFAALDEFRERLRRCRPGGLVFVLPAWGGLAGALNLLVESSPILSLNLRPPASESRTGRPAPSKRDAGAKTSSQPPEAAAWISAAPAHLKAVYKREGAAATMELPDETPPG